MDVDRFYVFPQIDVNVVILIVTSCADNSKSTLYM